ncbi:MAG: hypothetical protein QW791_07580 [Candidatus Bathyarchaeia archaeon]
MKPKKKHIRIKAKMKAEKEKRLAVTVFFVFMSMLIILSVYFGFQIFQFSQDENALPEPTQTFMPANSNPEHKAAIVDQLSLTLPNQTFIQKAADTLTKANYAVDYYSGEKVTVNFYKNLPTGRYKLIILRVHSTATEQGGKEGPVMLFTSETYDSSKYSYEQLTGQLCSVRFLYENGTKYFGVSPLFIVNSMKGKFQNTVIIMMGCQGLDNTLMAQAFIQKGASVYISWNKGVTASHTDSATTHLLQHFIIDKMTVKQAIQETYKELGADPLYKSLLIAYPLEALNYTIDYINKQ